MVEFWGFWGFCCFILCHSASWLGFFFFFAASYFVVLRVGWVFGFFAAFYFVVLRIVGFLLLHTVSFCELVGFWGFLGFLLLHTLSFCELVGFFFFFGFCCFILCRSASWWGFGGFAASYLDILLFQGFKLNSWRVCVILYKTIIVKLLNKLIQLVSLISDSQAIIGPVTLPLPESDAKSVCPKEVCVIKRQTKRTWWIECSTCKQWFHQRCVKISKEKAKNDNLYCFKCT